MPPTLSRTPCGTRACGTSCERCRRWLGGSCIGPARSLDRLLTQSVQRGGFVQSRSGRESGRPSRPPALPVWIRATRTWLRDDGEGDGPQSTASSGCSCTVAMTSSNQAMVVGDGRAVTRIELDPVATASGCDDRQGAADQSSAAVYGDGLGRRRIPRRASPSARRASPQAWNRRSAARRWSGTGDQSRVGSYRTSTWGAKKLRGNVLSVQGSVAA